MINVQTKDGVRICEVKDGSLWTLGHSVTRCRMSQPACEAALLFVPHVTYGQLESIVRRISTHDKQAPFVSPTDIARMFMVRPDRRALAEIEDRERATHDYGAATVHRLLSYGFCEVTPISKLLSITAAGRIALEPKPVHNIHVWCESGLQCGDMTKVTCLKCQLAAEQNQ